MVSWNGPNKEKTSAKYIALPASLLSGLKKKKLTQAKYIDGLCKASVDAVYDVSYSFFYINVKKLSFYNNV